MTNDNRQSGSAVVICSIVGWICIALFLAALYRGGKPQPTSTLRSLSGGNISYTIGSAVGGAFLPIISLLMGIITRKHGAGVALLMVSVVMIVISIFTM